MRAERVGRHTADVTISTARARTETREPLLTGPFIRLTLADVAYFTATGVAIYTLPLWVTGPVGSDKSGAGLAFGVFAVSALVLRPFAGRLADTRGRRPLLVGGALLSAVGMLGTAYAETLALVVLLRLLLGVAEAAFFVASIAALIDLAPPSRIGEATSYNSLGLYLGLAFGPPLGELLVRTAGFGAAWYGATVLSVIAAVVAAQITNVRSAAPTSHPAKLIHWKAVPAALGFFASVVAMGAFFAFGSLQANAVGLMPASAPLFIYGLVVVAGRLSLARFLDRFPALPLGAVALGIIAAALMIMAFWSTPIGMASAPRC
jgi:predicted MFS family arabinose efflux permease